MLIPVSSEGIPIMDHTPKGIESRMIRVLPSWPRRPGIVPSDTAHEYPAPRYGKLMRRSTGTSQLSYPMVTDLPPMPGELAW